MAVNGKPSPPQSGLRFEAHWRTVSWALLDKSLQLVFGLAFLLVVVRALPREEFGLQGVAGALILVLSQTFRSLVLVPLIKFVAEGSGAERTAATGTLLYVAASVLAAVVLLLGRTAWAGLFQKPELAAVLAPSACLLALGSPRDAAVAALEGQRRLRRVFVLDATYYLVAIAMLLFWRAGDGPRTAAAVQWVHAAAAAVGAAVALAATRALLLRAPDLGTGRRILRFGASFLGSGLGATLAQQADLLLAGRLMDARSVGVYNAAKQLFRVFNVLAQAINQVLMPLVSRLDAAGRTQDLRALFEKSVCFLTLALGPVCLALIALAPWLLELLLPGRYAESATVFQILVAGALTLPLASVASPFLTGLGSLRALLGITWAALVLGLGLAVLWIPVHGPQGAAWASAVAALFGMLARAAALKPRIGFRWGGIVGRVADVTAFLRRRLGSERSA